MEYLAGSLCILSLLVALLLQPASTVAYYADSLEGRVMPRSRADPINIPIHTLQVRSPADNRTFGASLNTLSLANDKQSYFTIIRVGDLLFRVDIDTGSADLWLISSDCQTTTCKNVPKYPLNHPSPSFAAFNSNQTFFNARYADTTFASGFVGRETIGLASSNLTLANQIFGVVTDSNVTLTDQASGILGLGFPRLSSIPNSPLNATSTSFFATLAARGLLEYPLFALSLTRNSTGSLTLGAIDSSVVANVSKISWNKVAQFPPFNSESNSSRYLQWAIPLAAITVNDTRIAPIPTYPTAGRPLALFDVGSPGIYGPYQDVSRMFAMIDGARLVDGTNGQWALPCDTTLSMAFSFGLQNYTLLPTDYIIGPASGNPNLCLSWPVALPPNTDGVDWQMGSAFLRTVYSVYSFGINDKEPPLIGLYPLQNITTNITEAQVSSFLSANSATVATTLPNFILPTPTYTTGSYAFNTSVSVTIGGIMTSGLANSTYSAIFGQKTVLSNITALPLITPAPSIVTVVLTDSAGAVSTSLSIRSLAAVTLGLPSTSRGLDLPSAFFVLVPVVWMIVSTLFLFE